MSEIVPHKKVIERAGRFRQYNAEVAQLDFNDGTCPVRIKLSDGTEDYGTCLGCHDTPCMILSVDDLTLPEVLSAFPGDPTRYVCPTRALSWNESGTVLVIDDELCIGCCLCVARCPYGAISSTVEGNAVVEKSDPGGLTTMLDELEETTGHTKPERIGLIVPVRSPAMKRILGSMGSIGDTETTQFVRNLLIECGITCRTRRKGDTNMRIDGLVGFTNGRLGVLEIELGNSVLDSPRALLEDIAVLHGRYGIDVNSIEAVSVILGLPNARSEYFQVIADIEKVLGIRCRTLTIGALLTVLWNNLKIGAFKESLFMTLPSNTNLLIGMRKYISDTIPATEPYPGAYRPSK